MNTPIRQYTIGEPRTAGPLAVFPVLGPAPQLEYRTFAQATQLGALAREIAGSAAVRSLVVENPMDLPLLLYEGEEVLGAQQNRTFDDSVLVAAGAKLRLDVSCVEAGRWEGSRHAEPLHASPQAADPGLRRLKRARARSTGRADQGEVWEAVGRRLEEHGVVSRSAAMSDVYDRRREDLRSLARAIGHVEGQVGAVAAVSGRPVVLDLVSRADAFATLLPRLAQGYALDALGAGEVAADPDTAVAFLAEALTAPRVATFTPGMGRGVEIGSAALIGSGLEYEEELIQLSAFPAAGRPERPYAAAARARIARPSRRRPGTRWADARS
jgi:ARG and Rhodanese-Phosphatase-superfamily-associated Protein domain